MPSSASRLVVAAVLLAAAAARRGNWHRRHTGRHHGHHRTAGTAASSSSSSSTNAERYNLLEHDTTCGSGGVGPTPRVVMFKVSRTGSTWLADLLANSNKVAFFAGEAQGCTGYPELLDRALHTILAAPTCHMTCRTIASHPEWREHFTRWIDAKPTDADVAGLAGKLVGFSVNEMTLLGEKEGDLTWADWPRYLRLPGVTTVVYVRTNQIKHAVSRLHVEVLKDVCDTHKTITDEAQRCVEEHQAELNSLSTIGAHKLAKVARNIGTKWQELLSNAVTASGGPVFLLFYEALQTDSRKELDRLFVHVGLPDRKTKASSGSVKITPDDLRQTLANFSAIDEWMQRKDPDFVPMLRDRNSTLFRTLYTEDGGSMSLAAFDGSRGATE